MAGDWTPMRNNLRGDPRTVTMSAMLGIDVDAVVGKLLAVWAWAGDHTTTGSCAGVRTFHVDAAARCEDFGKSMVEVEWLIEKDDDSIIFPRWGKYNAKAAKRRIQTAARAARLRAQGVRSERTKSAPTEEKRREEIRDGEGGPSPSARTRPSRSEPLATIWGNGPIRLDTQGRAWMGITEADAKAWAEAYPSVDIGAARLRAMVWCLANPTRGKKSNYGRFLAAWFSREQDNGHGSNGTGTGPGAGHRQVGAGKGDGYANHIAGQRERDARVCGDKPKFPGE